MSSSYPLAGIRPVLELPRPTSSSIRSIFQCYYYQCLPWQSLQTAIPFIFIDSFRDFAFNSVLMSFFLYESIQLNLCNPPVSSSTRQGETLVQYLKTMVTTKVLVNIKTTGRWSTKAGKNNLS